jgi:hypothetical protein
VPGVKEKALKVEGQFAGEMPALQSATHGQAVEKVARRHFEEPQAARKLLCFR